VKRVWTIEEPRSYGLRTVLSYWSTAEKAQKALRRMRERQPIVYDKLEVIEHDLDFDGFGHI